MRGGVRVCLAAFVALTATVCLAASQTALPLWPYEQDPPKGSPPPPPDDGQPHHLPGSTKAYTMAQVDGTGAVDWFAQTPKPPAAVMDGKPGLYRGCGNCHLINGNGKPDEQSVNGLPEAYMRQQLADMKNGLRHTSIVQGGADNMIAVAKAVSDADAEEAIAYFHATGPAKWIRVVEAETVPKTIFGKHAIAIADPSGAKEPLGSRILEMPESYYRTLLRDPTSGYVAYVPPGSLAKGAALVKTGGRTMACATCHGANLRGADIVPPIAGRSPTALGRQLYDFKTGARHGKNAAAMKPVVANLTDEDIIDITAYLASLPQ